MPSRIKVRVRLHNKETDEIKEQEIFMGDFPLDDRTAAPSSSTAPSASSSPRSSAAPASTSATRSTRPSSTSIPRPSSRTAARGWSTRPTPTMCSMSASTKTASCPSPCLIRALGVAHRRPDHASCFGEDPLHQGHAWKRIPCKTREEALLEIYRRLRPGEPPTVESAESYLDALFFDARRYDVTQGRPL